MASQPKNIPHSEMRIDEQTNIDQLKKDYKLSNRQYAVIKAWQDKKLSPEQEDNIEDVLYISKDELNILLEETRGTNNHLDGQKTIEELDSVKDSYEILQATNLDENLSADSNPESLEQGRENLQKFSEMVDNISESFLFGNHESPLYQTTLNWQQRSNLVTGMSFYLSEKLFSKVDGDSKLEELQALLSNVGKGEWFNALKVIGNNLDDLKGLAKPFQSYIDDAKNKITKEKIEKNAGLLTDPANAKYMLNDLIEGREIDGESNQYTKDIDEKNTELVNIGKNWEKVIDEAQGKDIAGIIEMTKGGKSNLDFKQKAKLFLSTSLGKGIKEFLKKDGLLQWVVGIFLSMVFGIELSELLGTDKIDEKKAPILRKSVVDKFENINDAEELLRDDKGEFDTATANRLHELKVNSNESTAETLERLSGDSDFKKISEKLTSTGNIVDNDKKVTQGMNEAINHHYEFSQEKTQKPNLNIDSYIENKTTKETDEAEVTEEEKKEIQGKKEVIRKDSSELLIISKIGNSTYETKLDKKGNLLISSSSGKSVKYIIEDTDFQKAISTEWDSFEEKDIAQGEIKSALKGILGEKGDFNKNDFTLKLKKLEAIRGIKFTHVPFFKNTAKVAMVAVAAAAAGTIGQEGDSEKTEKPTTTGTSISESKATTGQSSPEGTPETPLLKKENINTVIDKGDIKYKKTGEINHIVPDTETIKKSGSDVLIKLDENHAVKLTPNNVFIKINNTTSGTKLYKYSVKKEGTEYDDILNAEQYKLNISYKKVKTYLLTMLSDLDKSAVEIQNKDGSKKYATLYLEKQFSDTQKGKDEKIVGADNEFILYPNKLSGKAMLRGKYGKHEFNIHIASDEKTLIVEVGNLKYKSTISKPSGWKSEQWWSEIGEDYTSNIQGDEIFLDSTGFGSGNDIYIQPKKLIQTLINNGGARAFRFGDGPIGGSTLVFEKF